jgi:hypothetical protein
MPQANGPSPRSGQCKRQKLRTRPGRRQPAVCDVPRGPGGSLRLSPCRPSAAAMDSAKAAEIIADAREGFDLMHTKLDATDAIEAEIRPQWTA